MHLKSISMFLAFILIFTACEEESNDSGDASALMGAWELVSMSARYGVVSSTDQQALLLFAPGTGAITVSGDLNMELGYIFAMDFGPYQAVMISNQVMFDDVLPAYMLTAYLTGNECSLALDVVLEDSSAYSFMSDSAQAVFDAASFSFQLNPITLTSSDGAKVVTLSGSLAVRQVSIPADVYTEIDYFEDVDMSSLMTYTLNFQEDNSLLIITSEITEASDTTEGTWEVEKGELVITTLDGEGGLVTGDISHEIHGDELILESIMDCGEEANEASCISEGENLLGLEAGSLSEFKAFETLLFTRPGSGKRILSGRKGLGAMESNEIHQMLRERATLQINKLLPAN